MKITHEELIAYVKNNGWVEEIPNITKDRQYFNKEDSGTLIIPTRTTFSDYNRALLYCLGEIANHEKCSKFLAYCKIKGYENCTFAVWKIEEILTYFETMYD